LGFFRIVVWNVKNFLLGVIRTINKVVQIITTVSLSGRRNAVCALIVDGQDLQLSPWPVATEAASLRFVDSHDLIAEQRFERSLLKNRKAVRVTTELLHGVASLRVLVLHQRRVIDFDFDFDIDIHRRNGTVGDETSCGEIPLFNSQMVEITLLICFQKNILLNGRSAHQAVDMDLARLPDSMRTILRLRIHCGVPVGVVEYNRIRPSEIDPKTSAPRGEDETEHLGIRIEAIHLPLPVLNMRRPIEPEIRVAVQVQKNFENIQHLAHLREDQASMCTSLQSLQQDIERL
jgi:hypothetical protein